MSDRQEVNSVNMAESGKIDSTAPHLTLIDFDSTDMMIQENISVQECKKPLKTSSTRWVHLNGVADVDSVSTIGKQFEIHSLIVEDILNTKHRPKVDLESDQICLILRDFRLNQHHQLESEQLSIIVNPNFVLSFQESNIPLFASIKNRVSNPKSRIRSSKSDFLFYALIDTIVDRYINLMDALADQIEELEDTVSALAKETPSLIHSYKHVISTIQRNVRPLREAVLKLLRDDSGIIATSSTPYLKDLHDHLLYISDMVDTYKETLSDMLEIYLSGLDRKTNEIVKILVIVSTILLPVTFIASFFGMNFQNMPFDWELGYPLAIVAMIIIGIVLTVYFRWRKWF